MSENSTNCTDFYTNAPAYFVCDCIDSGDTAFMLMATTFVFLQTPFAGLAQAGAIRRKNALSMIMQTLTAVVIGSVLWVMFGFSLTFGPSQSGIIGNFDFGMLLQLPPAGCHVSAPTIPVSLFAAFQMMFALMTPFIVTGSWAEKMNFRPFLIFITLWPIMVYYPLAHWYLINYQYISLFSLKSQCITYQLISQDLEY
jgi:Amt family ammonium transporter